MLELADDDGEQTALLDQEMDKGAIEQAEIAPTNPHATDSGLQHGDRALVLIGNERIILTDDDNKHIRRKTDLHILPILVWVYFLQGKDAR
jgi:hypothetical protein